jgi:transposase-like protein
MTCPKCQHQNLKRFGTYGKAKIQRYRCRDCGATASEPQNRPLGRHTTTLDDAVRVFTLLTEGMSVRAISRVTGIHKTTILSLLTTVADKCRGVFNAKVQNVRAHYVQADEAWTFVHTKAKRVRPNDPAEYGDQYVWLALDSDTKAILSFYVGKRDGLSAYEFVEDLSRRITGRCQLTTDGLDA